MNKFKSFVGKIKKNMFMYLIVWLVMVILFVAPLGYVYVEAQANGHTVFQEVISGYADAFLKFPITIVLGEQYLDGFLKCVGYFSIFYLIILFRAISKTLPKSEFDNIEHGSSDWCLPGEQYRILSKKNGLILAKDNYLPIDKTGNVNVLIVGRIWCW